jgi:hypothetical protein
MRKTSERNANVYVNNKSRHTTKNSFIGYDELSLVDVWLCVQPMFVIDKQSRHLNGFSRRNETARVDELNIFLFFVAYLSNVYI